MDEPGLNGGDVALLRAELEIVKEMFSHLPSCHKCVGTPFCVNGSLLYGRAVDSLDRALKMVSIDERPVPSGSFKLVCAKLGRIL